MTGAIGFIVKGLIWFIVILLFAIIAIKWSDSGVFDGVRGREQEYMSQTKKELLHNVVKIVAISVMVLFVVFMFIAAYLLIS